MMLEPSSVVARTLCCTSRPKLYAAACYRNDTAQKHMPRATVMSVSPNFQVPLVANVPFEQLGYDILV